MMLTYLPSVLSPPLPNTGISVERALKQILTLLEQVEIDESDPSLEDRVQASIDDVTVMLSCINRS